MAFTVVHNARVLQPDGRIATGSVCFDSHIRDSGTTDHRTAHTIDAAGLLLTPGLIDLHIHGIGAHSFERSPEDLLAGLRLLPKFGVTSVLPTLYRSLQRESLALLIRLADTLDQDLPVHVPGFHFEGPFLAIAGAGAHTLRADAGLLDELVGACRGRVAAMSISPEVPGIVPIIEWLVARNIVPFITHTQASVEQTQRAIDAGARHATHFYDVFPSPAETEAGVRPVGAVEVLLGDSRATVDFICDGVHVHPAAIRAAFAAKGGEGVIAITDANVGAGLGAGTYETPWGYSIRLEPGDAARVADATHPLYGKIAGSGLTMNQAVANLLRWQIGDAATPWQMATRNPALRMGLSDRGQIQIGGVADLVLWDETLQPTRVWSAGRDVTARG